MNNMHIKYKLVLVACLISNGLLLDAKVGSVNKKIGELPTSFAVNYKTYHFSERDMERMFELEKLTDYTIYRRSNDWNNSRIALLTLLEENKNVDDLIKILISESEKKADIERLTDDFIKIVNKNPLQLRLTLATISLLVKQRKIAKASAVLEFSLNFFEKNIAVLKKIKKQEFVYIETLAVVYCELNNISDPSEKLLEKLKFIQNFPIVKESTIVQGVLLKLYAKAIKYFLKQQNSDKNKLLLASVNAQKQLLLSDMKKKSMTSYNSPQNLKQILLSLNKLKSVEHNAVAEELLLNNLLLKPNDFLTLSYLALHYGRQGKYSLSHDLWLKASELYKVRLQERIEQNRLQGVKNKFDTTSKERFYLFLALDMAIKGCLQYETKVLADRLDLATINIKKEDLAVKNIAPFYTYSSQAYLTYYDYQKAYNISTKPIGETRNNYLIGDILMRQGKYDDAKDFFDQFALDLRLSSMPKNKVSKLFLLSYINCLLKANNYEKALKILNENIDRFQNDVTWLNYLGYTLVDNNQDLARAESLIRKSLQILSKQDPTLQNIFQRVAVADSLAWCLFKQKKIIDAVEIVDKVLEKMQGDGVIINAFVLDHFADIYQANKEYRKAKELWEKALVIYDEDVDYQKIENKMRKLPLE